MSLQLHYFVDLDIWGPKLASILDAYEVRVWTRNTNTTRHGYVDTVFLKKVGHGHFGDILNNIFLKHFL